MGQYFKIVNLDKKEVIHPHRLSQGAKLWEIGASDTLSILTLALRKSSEGGGGDVQKNFPSMGRWAGDRIVLIGDYDESGLYQTSREWKDVSKEFIRDYNKFIELKDKKFKYDKPEHMEQRIRKLKKVV